MAGRLGSGLWEEILQARHVHHRERRGVEGASRETWRADQVIDWRAELAGAELDRAERHDEQQDQRRREHQREPAAVVLHPFAQQQGGGGGEVFAVARADFG